METSLSAIVDKEITCGSSVNNEINKLGAIKNSKRLGEHKDSLKNRREHDVLNAKFHAREAEIVAQAGVYGKVTIYLT